MNLSRNSEDQDQSQQRQGTSGEQRRPSRISRFLRRTRLVGNEVPYERIRNDRSSSEDDNDDQEYDSSYDSFDTFLSEGDAEQRGFTNYSVPTPLVNMASKRDRSSSNSIRNEQENVTVEDHNQDSPSSPVNSPDIDTQLRQATAELINLRNQIAEARDDEFHRNQEFEQIQEAKRQEKKLQRLILLLEKKKKETKEEFKRSFGSSMNSSPMYVNNTQGRVVEIHEELDDALTEHLTNRTDNGHLINSTRRTQDNPGERRGTHEERMEAIDELTQRVTVQLNPDLLRTMSDAPRWKPFNRNRQSKSLGLIEEAMRNHQGQQDGAQGGLPLSATYNMGNEGGRRMHINQMYIIQVNQQQKAKDLLKALHKDTINESDDERFQDANSPHRSSPSPIPTVPVTNPTLIDQVRLDQVEQGQDNAPIVEERSLGAISKQPPLMSTPKSRKTEEKVTIENVTDESQLDHSTKEREIRREYQRGLREKVAPHRSNTIFTQDNIVNEPPYSDFRDNLRTIPNNTDVNIQPFGDPRVEHLNRSSVSNRTAASTPSGGRNINPAAVPEPTAPRYIPPFQSSSPSASYPSRPRIAPPPFLTRIP